MMAMGFTIGAAVGLFNAVGDRLDPVEKWTDTLRLAAFDLQVHDAVVAAIIARESGGNSEAIGDLKVKTGKAIGLMQVRPPAFQDIQSYFGDRFADLSHDDLIGDPTLQIYAGTAYLRMMLDRFKNTFMAVTAYNRGPSHPMPYTGYTADVMSMAWVWDLNHRFRRWER